MVLFLFFIFFFSFSFDSLCQGSNKFSFKLSTFKDEIYFCIKSKGKFRHLIIKDADLIVSDTVLYLNFISKNSPILNVGPSQVEDINFFLSDSSYFCFNEKLDIKKVKSIVIYIQYINLPKNFYYLLPIPDQKALKRMTKDFKEINEYSSSISFSWEENSSIEFE
jgi:hypothetical protein